jgi:hypothetical protein
MRTFFRLMVGIGLTAAFFAWPLPGGARDTSVFANPYPGSVLSPQPYYPSFCSVLQPGPCQPEINYPFGQNLQLTIRSRAPEQPQKVAALPPTEQKNEEATKERRLNTIDDMFAALRACWEPPAKDESRVGTQLSVRLSFKRNGEPVGPPRVTYVSSGTSKEVRQTYLDAVTASLKRCTPLPFSKGLGGALAGRPIAIRFIDDR